MPNSSHQAQLGQMWDTLQQSGALDEAGVDPDEVGVILALHRAPDVPPPDAAVIERIWSTVAAVSLPAGEVQNELADVESPSVAPAEQNPASRRTAFATLYRTAIVAALSGLLTGFVVFGGGGRLAMRLAAILSADELQGATTENFETVGEITLGGTLNLMFTGGLFGAGLGIGFALIASLLPASGWRRVVFSGLFFFAVCGFTTLEGGNNRDYERFGIAGLNVCIFTLLPLLFGLAIPLVHDIIDRRMPQQLGRSRRQAVLTKALFPLVFIGIGVLLFVPPLQLFLLGPVVAVAGARIGKGLRRPSARWVMWSNRLALGLPAVAGVLMTVVAITRIL